MPTASSSVLSPLLLLRERFGQSVSSGESHDHFVTSVFEHYRHCLTSVDLAKVPFLNGCKAVNKELLCSSGQLVRFRCMVQDMLSPEYFLGRYELKHLFKPSDVRVETGLLQDTIDIPHEYELLDNPSTNITSERSLFCCSTIPGEMKWVQDAYFHTSAAAATTVDVACSDIKEASSTVEKRCNDDLPDQESKRLKSQESKSNDVPLAAGLCMEQVASKSDLQQTIGDDPMVLVKVYKDADSIKLNECYEFLGVASTTLAQDEHDKMETDNNVEAVSAMRHTLHVVAFHKLDHINPLTSSVQLKDATHVQDEIVSLFATYLLGDRLAAEYLLYSLVARVYSRQNTAALGKLCLNLYNVPTEPEFMSTFVTMLQTIMTKCQCVEIQLSTLNQQRFVPKKNYQTDRLETGLLQLSDSTVLVLDETKLRAGQLTEQGLNNIAALKDLIVWQKVSYDFQFYRSEFPTDVNVLVLSEGKSCLESDVMLPLQACSSMDAGSGPDIADEHFLAVCRVFLTHARLRDYSVNDAMQTVVQDDFVQMRREDRDVNAQHLHTLLVLARLIALCRGESTMTAEVWQKAKVLEGLRAERNKQMKQRWEEKRNEAPRC